MISRSLIINDEKNNSYLYLERDVCEALKNNAIKEFFYFTLNESQQIFSERKHEIFESIFFLKIAFFLVYYFITIFDYSLFI